MGIKLPDKLKIRSLTIFCCFFLSDVDFEGFTVTNHSGLKIRLFFEHVHPGFSFVDSDGTHYEISRSTIDLDSNDLVDENVSVAEVEEELGKQLALITQGVTNASVAGLEIVIPQASLWVKPNAVAVDDRETGSAEVLPADAAPNNESEIPAKLLPIYIIPAGEFQRERVYGNSKTFDLSKTT